METTGTAKAKLTEQFSLSITVETVQDTIFPSFNWFISLVIHHASGGGSLLEFTVEENADFAPDFSLKYVWYCRDHP